MKLLASTTFVFWNWRISFYDVYLLDRWCSSIDLSFRACSFDPKPKRVWKDWEGFNPLQVKILLYPLQSLPSQNQTNRALSNYVTCQSEIVVNIYSRSTDMPWKYKQLGLEPRLKSHWISDRVQLLVSHEILPWWWSAKTIIKDGCNTFLIRSGHLAHLYLGAYVVHNRGGACLSMKIEYLAHRWACPWA